ncbi:protein kinase domain-containing protein [Apiospora sp. TS-2023a]
MDTRLLRRQLQGCMVKSESMRCFIPDGVIEGILTLQTIEEIVPTLNCKSDQRIGLANRIHKEGQKTFAILVLMSEEDSIVVFRDHNLLDRSLPLSIDEAKVVDKTVGYRFVQSQWDLLPYEFDHMMWENHQQIAQDTILPFIENPEPVGEGAFGVVERVHIQPSQQDFIASEFQRDFVFYSALRGLGHALSQVHSLRLSKRIHDFGLGNLKPAEDESWTPIKSNHGDWVAPECMGQEYGTRAVDVWAFGCLAAETATYMQSGAAAVGEFSERRLSKGFSGWRDSTFCQADGTVKKEVREWLDGLKSSASASDRHLTSSLVALSLSALTSDLVGRPNMTQLCDKLTFLSMKAHSNSVRMEYTRLLDTSPGANTDVSTNGVWFLQARFCAWDRTLGLQGDSSSVELLEILNRIHDGATKIMSNLVHQLEHVGTRGMETPGNRSKEGSVDWLNSESQVNRLVEALWDLLPHTLQRRAQDHWHQDILSNDSSSGLDVFRTTLKTQYPVHDIVDAMAKMKKLRLHMLRPLHPNSLKETAEACTISLNDLEFVRNDGYHTTGLYKNNIHVVIEDMRHKPRWDDVDANQRRLVVNLKAQSLGVEPAPKGMRTLKCIGAFEEEGEKANYGLVYSYPKGRQSSPVTLLQHLNFVYNKRRDKNHHRWQPILGEKFQLAFSLADFLKEFHTLGWLHENFNSHNILFFRPGDEYESGDYSIGNELREPFVVGLHKSRPDGSFWQTDGPTADQSLQDYQHPDYYSHLVPFQQKFDYHSLGVVLLEIGLWRPLKSLNSRFTFYGKSDVREELKAICKEQLGVKMGAVYRDVVLRCMDGSLDSGTDEDSYKSSRERAILARFTENVIGPLENLAMASI